MRFCVTACAGTLWIGAKEAVPIEPKEPKKVRHISTDGVKSGGATGQFQVPGGQDPKGRKKKKKRRYKRRLEIIILITALLNLISAIADLIEKILK